jgi:hypothetical protein
MHSVENTKTFTGILAGLTPAHLQTWGLLDVVGLLPASDQGQLGSPLQWLSEGIRGVFGLSPTEQSVNREQFVSPVQHLKIVQVPTYGTVVLQNTAPKGIVIVPMHIGFFQEGAQNHATSSVLVLEAGEQFKATDCFCIQQSQGGFLKEAQQRFIILPLGLRQAALSQRGTVGYSRLWGDINKYNRRYGIARGGHLERFLRPYFPRLIPFRHAFELLPQQIGAAYFVAGKLVGVELVPNAAYWQDIWPVLNIYCYGPAAMLAERFQQRPARRVVDLNGLVNLDDLAQRLKEKRNQVEADHVAMINELSNQAWDYVVDKKMHGLSILHLQQGEWAGQMVRKGAETLYLSVFRDVMSA